MGFQGFENFGQNFAPLADAQLKQAYQDYQAQKDRQALEHQNFQERILAQKAAQDSGFDDPRVSRVELDPVTAKWMGAQTGVEAPKEEGTLNDPNISHMAPYIEQLRAKHPEVIDEQGKIHPFVYKNLRAMADLQAKGEREASLLSSRTARDIELAKMRGENRLQGIEATNKSRESLQGGKNETALKIQELKNKGMSDAQVIQALSRENVAKTRVESNEKIMGLREEGLDRRQDATLDNQVILQKLKGGQQIDLQEKRSLMEQAIASGKNETALKIAEGKALSAQEIEGLKQLGLANRMEAQIDSNEKLAAGRNKTAVNVAKAKSGTPSSGAARPQAYKKNAYEESLLEEIKGLNKVKTDIISSPQQKAAADQRIRQLQDRLGTYQSQGIIQDKPSVVQGGPPGYNEWLQKYKHSPSDENLKQYTDWYNSKKKGK